MPFGLSTAPQGYECLMELTLSGLQWSLCLIYLNDVIVFSHGFDEHIDRLDKVLTQIGAAGLNFKPSKCVFFAPKVSFLGHIVSQDGVSPDPDYIAEIANWPTPRNVHEVQKQNNTPHIVEGPKCQSNTKGLKPNPEPQTKAKKQTEGALGGDKSVPSQKESVRGWANKARVQGSSPPMNDSMTPSQTKSGRGISKKSKAQVGGSLSLNPAVLHQKQLDDPDIGPVLKWKESGQRPFGPEVLCLKPCNQALLELLGPTENTRWHVDVPFYKMQYNR